MQHLDTVLLLLCLTNIVGLYVYTFKTISGLREMLYKHQADAEKHVVSGDLVYRDVCEERVKRFEEKIGEVDKKIEKVDESVQAGFKEMKTLIQDKHS